MPEEERGELKRRPYVHIGDDYPAFVEATVRSGLQKLMPRKKIAKHRGRILAGGAFAVAKDFDEDRFVSDLPVNELLDPQRLPRPTFAYVPRFRTLRVRPGWSIRVSKRDARHYFHRLRIGRRWRPFLAHPAVNNSSDVPVHAAVPMEFGPAAGFA